MLQTASLRRNTAVLHAVLAQGAGAPTHATLGQASGLSLRSVQTAVSELRERELVETSPTRLGRGWGYVAAVALGAETCRAGLVDANGALLVEHEEPRMEGQMKLEPDALLERFAGAFEKLVAQASSRPELLIDGELPIIGVTTVWPCPVRGSRRPSGSVLHPAWRTREPSALHEAVAQRLGIDPRFSHALNDANAHALAVNYDRSRDYGMRDAERRPRISLVMRIGGGLGASTTIAAPHDPGRLSFVDSTMLGGARSLAGELGHLPVSESVVAELNEESSWTEGLAPLSTAWRCTCGRTGHLESLASGTAVGERMKASGVSMPELHEALRRGAVGPADRALAPSEDPRITVALEDAGRLIGRSLQGPVLLLDPSHVSLTGSYAVRSVLDGVIAERENWRHVFGDALHIDAPAGPDAQYIGVRGAALAVFRARVYREFDALLAAPEEIAALRSDRPIAP